MSTINTNGINVNYPVPGVNNSSQGFRDNFSSIKTNLNTAANEITDLQNKVVLKQALANSTLNNDMNGTQISNLTTRAFRGSTYQLGNALSGTVVIDASLGDVQYGTVAGNVTLQFTGWAQTGYKSEVQLSLGVSNSQAVISFPSQISSATDDYGITLLENYQDIASVSTVTVPNGVSQLNYTLTTLDCGNTIFIEPYNRPFQSTQIQQRSPSPTGFQGDVPGVVAVDDEYLYVCYGTYDSGGANTIVKTATATATFINEVTLNNVTSLVTDNPIIFSGTTFGGIIAGQVYYIKSIVGPNSSVTLSETRTAGVAGATFALTSAVGSCTATSYNGSDIWKRIALTSW